VDTTPADTPPGVDGYTAEDGYMLAGGYIASKWIYYQSEDILLIPLDWTHRSALSQESETLKLSLNSTISLFISKSRVNLGYPT